MEVVRSDGVRGGGGGRVRGGDLPQGALSFWSHSSDTWQNQTSEERERGGRGREGREGG